MRNNKKAFTLIELLAVIIILAIVALIATPIVLDVVDDARTSAAKSETAMIVSGINNYCATAEMKAQMNNTTSICADGVTKEEVALMVDLGNAKVLEIEYGNISTGEVAMVASLGNARVADATKKSGVTYLKVESNTKIVIYDGRTYKIDGEVVETPDPVDPTPTVYKDNSGANYPELLDNMIPVKYVDGNVVYADLYQEWYDYDAKEWANAVVLNSGVTKSVGDPISEDDIALMYVWIPRYTYTIFNGNNGSVEPQVIDVKFESGTNSSGTVTCQDAINQTDASGNAISEICTDKNGDGSIVNGTSTYTHPAFTFGTQDLKGFWVGKFEVSGTTDAIAIKSSVSPLVNLTVSEFFAAIQNMTNTYGINGDSHMIKNMEWGAVAYLKQSKYGLGETDLGINNYLVISGSSTSYKTGCGASAGSSQSTICNAYNTLTGMLASTTGNVYGVYDMSGGTDEYVMGNMANESGAFYNSNAGFTETLETKYFDSYTYDTSMTTHRRGKLGDATKETLTIFGSDNGGWTADYARHLENTYSWLVRGRSSSCENSAGVFAYSAFPGVENNSYSSRAVLVK